MRHGVDTIRCDLLDPAQVDRLPDAANVVGMTGMKFGTTGQEALDLGHERAWCRRTSAASFAAVAHRRVLDGQRLRPVTGAAAAARRDATRCSRSASTPRAAVGRERMYEHFSRTLGIPMVLLRLNYATEMRYGVLVDVARKVLRRRAVDLSMGHLNAIWQGDANAMTLCAFAHARRPALVLNLAGPEILSVRRLAEEFGRLLDQPGACAGSGDSGRVSEQRPGEPSAVRLPARPGTATGALDRRLGRVVAVPTWASPLTSRFAAASTDPLRRSPCLVSTGCITARTRMSVYEGSRVP